MKSHLHPSKAYALFEFVRGLLAVSATVYVPFLVSLGFSYAQVALLNAFFWGAIIIAELPTGMLADGKSRLWSIRAGVFMTLISAATYSAAQGFWMALLAEILMGIGFAFLSGAQQAWIVDALDHLAEGHRRREVMSQAAFMRGAGTVLGGLVGAYLGAWKGGRAVWMLEAFVGLMALLISIFCMRDQGEPVKRVSEVEALKKSVNLLRGHRGLVWAVLAVLLFGCVLPFNHYWAPFFAERVGQANLGFVWGGMFVTLALAGLLVRTGRVVFHGVNGVSLALFLSGVSLAFMGQGFGFVIPFLFLLLHEVGRGFYEPTLDLYIHDHVESQYRATYGSLQSFLGRMSYGVILLVVWFFTRHLSSTSTLIAQIWAVAGSVLAVGAVLLWLKRPRN